MLLTRDCDQAMAGLVVESYRSLESASGVTVVNKKKFVEWCGCLLDAAAHAGEQAEFVAQISALQNNYKSGSGSATFSAEFFLEGVQKMTFLYPALRKKFASTPPKNPKTVEGTMPNTWKKRN